MASPHRPMKYFRDELTRKLRNKRNFIIESDKAVVIKADYPKAQYHFRVVAKDELRSVTELTEEHLPLLDHLMDLANQVIDMNPILESRHFNVGFKINSFWNRLNLHVISNDFYSASLKRVKHWNSFNTELFLPFQVAYTMISLQGAIEPFSEEKCKTLQTQLPLECNHCNFSSRMLFDFKNHLFKHWSNQIRKRNQQQMVENLLKILEENAKPIDLGAVKTETSSTDEAPICSKDCQTPEQQPAEQPDASDLNEQIEGPRVNLMNLPSACNPFRNIPPQQPKKSQNRMSRAGFNNRGNMRPRAPQVHRNGPRYAPQQLQPDFRQPASSGVRGVQCVRLRPPPSNTNRNPRFQQGLFPTPNASIDVAPGAMTARPLPPNQQGRFDVSAPGNGNRPKWDPKRS